MSFSKLEQSSVPQHNSVGVIVDTNDRRLLKEAKGYLSIVANQPTEPKHILYFGDLGVELRSAERPSKKGYRIDFNKIDRRVGSGNLSKKNILPKAVGGTNNTIVDATAGLGFDAARMAMVGFNVIAIERSPVISIMLRDGLWRAGQIPELSEKIGGRLSLVEGDSRCLLSNYCGVDVVYIDPMFPPKRKKSALPPGKIQTLQTIVGFENQDESEQLFNLAMESAINRVVVKRPIHAPAFKENHVAVHKGKLVRYEVYKPK
ncbi:MAG: class I SAM-dependent methyltransferase [Phycisphaerales bacterium]|jgi:16S rRNA (guanine1516-N2)-methyltransferase|nr:class I SAM-dependent methyltransferase [Phycisphaerales bacterium]